MGSEAAEKGGPGRRRDEGRDGERRLRGLFFPYCILNTGKQVMLEQRIGPGLVGVTEGCIERPASVEIMVPGHGMVVSIRPAGVRRFVYFDQHFYIRVQVFEII